MIILDTNIISEPMKPNSNTAVTAWLDRQLAETLYLTATSFSELLVGIEILPDGKRKQELRTALRELIIKLFGPRILPFDQQAAIAYAPLIGRAKLGGQSISVADGQIAAIASVHGFTIATRDVSPFVAAGVPMINPWEQ
ncbi:MAG: type II toxin-antitoxin system VapC family toxin [Burkholderiales bacterium]|nr:type II toxin-antitoxin system VapC family toxin [Nitrosomonas sp.]MCP5274878.1 type II toxin-antitoxin system VapC family toxin [Burkholderiales bacterium]